ncbi:hypothetical protein V5799_024057 [Amblyomma americanum]|uniref:Uncharacterized protein n=1 Tax=Amblyomma americanum TaxID=6943 RepID=A0AAQ4EDL5_AMBAM
MEYRVDGEVIFPEEFDNDPRWSRAVRAHNKLYPTTKPSSSNDASAASSSGASPGKPAQLPQGKSTPPKIKKNAQLPRLTTSDLKIVFRPGGGLDLRPLNGGALLQLLCTGAEIHYAQARSQDKLRINPYNNSLTVSTSSEALMKRYVQLQELRLHDQQYPIHTSRPPTTPSKGYSTTRDITRLNKIFSPTSWR